MVKRLIFILTTVFCCSFLKGQTKNFIGFSVSFGHKSNYSFAGIAGQARLFNHLDLDFGGSYSFFNGYGYSGGISFIPLNTNLRPLLGFAYGKSFGVKKYDITEGETKTSYYKTSPVDYIYTRAGFVYEVEDFEGQRSANSPMFFVFALTYRKAISDYRITLVDGPGYKDEEFLNSKMEDGIGFSISCILLFGGN